MHGWLFSSGGISKRCNKTGFTKRIPAGSAHSSCSEIGTFSAPHFLAIWFKKCSHRFSAAEEYYFVWYWELRSMPLWHIDLPAPSMWETFNRLSAASLTLDLAKWKGIKRAVWKFGKAVRTYLGKKVGQGQVFSVAAKVQTIIDFPVSQTHCECKRFLGMTLHMW